MNKFTSTGKPFSEEVLLQRIAELERDNDRLSGLVSEMSGETEILRYRLELNELSFTESFDNIITAVVDAAEALSGSETGFFHFYDESTESLALQAWSTKTLKNCSALTKEDQNNIASTGVWTDCIRERKALIHNNYAELTHKRVISAGHVTITRDMTVPIFRDGIIVGVIGVGNKKVPYSEKDLENLVHFADLIWETVMNKQLSIELERKEDLHSTLLSTMFEGVALNELIFDDDGEISDYRIVEVNKAFRKYWLKGEDITGRLASEVYGSDKDSIRKFWSDNYLNEKPVVNDLIISGRWIRVSTSPIKNNMFTTVFFDISDTKLAEEKQKQSEERYRRISSLISNVAYSCRKKKEGFSLDWLAGSVQKIFGYTIEEMYELNCWKSLIVQDDVPVFMENIAGLKSGNKSDCEFRMKTKEGSIRWINSIAECFTEEGQEVIYGALIDITEDKIGSEALRLISEDLEEAQHIAKIGSWEYDLQTESLRLTGECRKIFGLGYKHAAMKWADLASSIHREDWDCFLEKSGKCVLGDIEEFSHELRITNGDGMKWANVIGKAITSEKKAVLGLKGTIQDITARKNAEEALNHSHDLMRYVIEHNRGAVAVHDRDLKYIYVSQRYLSDYQVADKDIIGKHHYDVFPDLPQKWRKAHQEALKGSILREENDIYEREDGTVEYTRWECRPWYEADQTIGGIIVYTEVISERRRIELALKNSEFQLNAMFNSAPVIMILLNERSEVLKMNKFGQESTGRNLESITGLKTGDVMSCVNAAEEGCGKAQECRLCTMKSVIESTFNEGKEFFKVETQIVTSPENPKIHTILVSTSIISNLPQKQVLITIDEITSRKELETELIKAKERAEESDELKSAFLANISHEIRTPMNGIMGFSEMLTKPGLTDEKRKQFTSLVQDGCKQLLSIITDVIEISMLDSDQLSVSRSEININNFMHDLFLQFRSAAATKNLNLNYIKTSKEAGVFTDQEKLKHIFSNLLSNAIKFTKQGYVQYGCSIKGNSVEFYVSDTGIGIEKELFAAVFERFRQAETSDTRNYGGTGLGLSIAKGLTALLGGRIWLESEPGIGTTFFFTIPDAGLSIVREDEKIPDYPENEILIAEDDEINFLFIQEVLQDINCFPYHARNGQEALQALKDHPGIRLVLMDIKMPVMDGYEAASVIKRLYPSLPVYAQTAYPVSASAEEMKNKGFAGFIMKPIDKDRLEFLIRKHISLP